MAKYVNILKLYRELGLFCKVWTVKYVSMANLFLDGSTLKSIRKVYPNKR
jgi:hypothetical protein